MTFDINDIDLTNEQESFLEALVEHGAAKGEADPGTGKSMTILAAIDYLTGRGKITDGATPEKQIPPENILVVMFGDADEVDMREKLSVLFGGTVPVAVTNYHSLGERLRSEYELVLERPLDRRLIRPTVREDIIESIAADIEEDMPAAMTIGGDPASHLESLIRVAKSVGYSPTELATALPDSDVLKATADLLDQFAETEALDPDTERIDTDPEAALEATERTVRELQGDIAWLRTKLEGGGRFELLLDSYLGYLEELCQRQLEFLEAHAQPEYDGGDPVLRVSRRILSTMRGSHRYFDHLDPKLAEWGLYRVPMEPVWWAVRDLLLAHKYQPGFEAYEYRLARMDSPRYDHADQLLEAIELLEGSDCEVKETDRYEVVLADEFQDISLPDYNLVEHFAESAIAGVCGDNSQNIFAFRGSLPLYLDERFPEDFAVEDPTQLTWVFRAHDQNLLDIANEIGTALDDPPEMRSWPVANDAVPPVIEQMTPVLTTNVPFDEGANFWDTEYALDAVIDRLQEIITGEVETLDTDGYDVLVGLRRNKPVPKLHEKLRDMLEDIDTDAADVEIEVRSDQERDLPPSIRNRIDALAVAHGCAESDAVRRLLRERFGLAEEKIDFLTDQGSLDVAVCEGIPLTEAAEDAQTKLDAIRNIATRTPLIELLATIERELDLEEPTAAHESVLYEQLRSELRAFRMDDEFDDDVVIEIVERELRQSAPPSTDGDAGAIRIVLGTWHQMKGDEADRVLLPCLLPPFWSPSRDVFDVLHYVAAIPEERVADVTSVDFVHRAEQESRRLYHVALSRPRCQLHLIGDDGGSPPTNPRNPPMFDIDEFVPQGQDWTRASHFDPWGEAVDAIANADIERDVWRPVDNSDAYHHHPNHD